MVEHESAQPPLPPPAETGGEGDRSDRASAREVPLRLEDSGEGSTQPVSASRAASGTAAGSSGPAGTSTGGFDTMLGKLVVQSGLATPEEVEECAAVSEASSSGEAPQSLSELLVEREFLTGHQLRRLRREFEAQKSSQRIPGYKIMKKLGSGAMATVFLARQVSLDRLVAIKVLPKKFSGNDNFIDRFYKEGRAVAQLNHPNIVGAYDVGRAGDHHYFVMEYVDGPTLYERINKKKRLDESDAINIVTQVAHALKHAHERGFVHRDIKPKNVMITKSGVVKLADLGLARAIDDEETAKAEAGRAYGTPYYISPEQIRGEMDIGPPADIYGLGATFFHMVTGRVPFEGKSPTAVMHKHLKTALEPPDHLNPELSAGCAQIIEMMMAKKARDRYRSADDLLEDLALVASGEAPHFAHRALDHVTMSDVVTDVAVAPSEIPKQAPDRAPVTQNPLFMVVLVVACLSVIANLVLLAIVLS